MEHVPVTAKISVEVVAFDYARLSRDRKKLSENVNIQHRENRYFIEEQCWEHGGSREDNDISASKFGVKVRKGYEALIDDIKNVSDRDGVTVKVVIVVTEMPRLYRQVEELLPLIKMAEYTKLSGIWTTDGEGYDLSTPEGIHRAIGAVNNAMLESNRASTRQRRKKQAQAAQGKYMGGHRRYGFEGVIKDEHGNIINRDRINIAEIPEEVANWTDWFNRLIAGESQISIIRSNNKRSIPSTDGGRWTVANFKRLMSKEAYVIFDATGHPQDCPCLENLETSGTLFHKPTGTKHRARWRGLITPEQHELLVNRFRETAQQWDHGLIKGRRYLASGLMHCGGTFEGKPCGAPMYGNGRTLDNGRYQLRYRCKCNNNHGDRVACGKVFRDAQALDAFITEAILYRLDTPDMARSLASTEDAGSAEELTRKIMMQRRRRDLIKKQYARGEIETIDEYKFMRGEADTAIEELQAELGKLRSAKAASLLPTDGRIRETWEQADLAWRRSIIQLVIKDIIVYPGAPGAKMWNGYRFDPSKIRITWNV
jgi:site-specific DNA recombinase